MCFYSELVGEPVDKVPRHEQRRGDPHRPGVDIVHQLRLGAGQPVLLALGRDVTGIIVSNLIPLTSKSLVLSKVPLMMLFRCLSKLSAVITILSFLCPVFVIRSNFLSGMHLVFRIMRIAAYSSRAPVK